MISSRIARLSARSIAGIIFAVAVVVRIAFIYAVIGFHTGESDVSRLNGDERDYLRRAENVMMGHGFTAGGEHDRMWRTPAYPLLLLPITAVGGRQLAAIRFLQALLGGLACVLLFAVARRIFDPTVATLAAMYFAFYPPHAHMAGQILSENLLLPVVLLATLQFLRAAETPTIKQALLSGMLAGLAALIKPEAGTIAIVMVAVMWLIKGERKLLRGATLLFTTALVFAPWLARNYGLSGQFVVSSVGGEAFWGGNNEYVLNVPKHRGYWMQPSDMPEQFKLVLAEPTEIKRDRKRWELGLDFIRSHPGDLPRLAWYKFRRFYSVMVQDRRERLALILSFGWLLPFIAAGVLINTRRFMIERRAGLILIGVILYYNLLAIVFWGSNRMRLVIDPMLILFGVWAVRAVARYGLNMRSVTRPQSPEFS